MNLHNIGIRDLFLYGTLFVATLLAFILFYYLLKGLFYVATIVFKVMVDVVRFVLKVLYVLVGIALTLSGAGILFVWIGALWEGSPLRSEPMIGMGVVMLLCLFFGIRMLVHVSQEGLMFFQHVPVSISSYSFSSTTSSSPTDSFYPSVWDVKQMEAEKEQQEKYWTDREDARREEQQERENAWQRREEARAEAEQARLDFIAEQEARDAYARQVEEDQEYKRKYYGLD